MPTSPFPTFSSEIDNSTPVTEPSDGGGADGYSPSSHIRQLIRDLGSEPKLIKSSTECIRPMDLYKNRSIHNIHEHERVQCARAKQVFDPTVLGANEREFTRYKLAHITKTYIPSGMHHETIDEVKMHRRWPLKRKCIEMPGNCGVCSAVKILLFIMLLISIGLVLYDPCFWIIFKQDTNHTVGHHSSKSTKTTTTTMTITPKLKAINELNAKNHNVTRSTSIPKHLIQEKHKNCGFKIYAIVLASFGVLLLFITFIAYTFHLVITYNRFSWFLAEAIICSVYYIALFATSIGSYIFGNQISGTFCKLDKDTFHQLHNLFSFFHTVLLISIIGFVTSVWIYGYYSSDVTPWLVVTTPDPDMDELAQIMGRRQFSKLFQFGKQMSDITLHQQMSNTNILKKVVDKIHPQKTLNSLKTKR